MKLTETSARSTVLRKLVLETGNMRRGAVGDDCVLLRKAAVALSSHEEHKEFLLGNPSAAGPLGEGGGSGTHSGLGFWELLSKNTWVTQGGEPVLYITVLQHGAFQMF